MLFSILIHIGLLAFAFALYYGFLALCRWSDRRQARKDRAKAEYDAAVQRAVDLRAQFDQVMRENALLGRQIEAEREKNSWSAIRIRDLNLLLARIASLSAISETKENLK